MAIINKSGVLLRTSLTMPHCLFAQQVRTTFILKRQVEPKKKNPEDLRPPQFRREQFYYDMVQDANTVRQPDLSVILTSYVEGLGDRGTIVSTRPGFARYHLLLPGLAIYASPENVKLMEEEILMSKERQPTFSSAFSPITMKIMKKTVFGVLMSSESPWTVLPWHIRVSLRNAGFVIPENAIEMPAVPIVGPAIINQNKDFAVFITINNRERFPIRCRLHHSGIPLENQWNLEKSDAILPDQQEILDSIPYPDVKQK